MTSSKKTNDIAVEMFGRISHAFDVNHNVDISHHIFVDSKLTQRAAETLVHWDEDELLISIRCSEALVQRIESVKSPFEELNNQNINSFSILLEEISHFHYICSAAVGQRPISKWDLELQAEFDKIMIAATILNEQTGSPHFYNLARILFDGSRIYDKAQPELYSSTENTAAKWWWTKINQEGDDLVKNQHLFKGLKKIRDLQGESKMRYIQDTQTLSGLKKSA
jgi:hypothetical protein